MARSKRSPGRVHRLDLDSRHESDAERVEHTLRPFDGDAVILVPLVSRDHRLVHAKLLGELSLRHASGDPEADQDLAESLKILELAELTALESLVALNLFDELSVKRLERLTELRHLFGGEALSLPLAHVLGKSLPLSVDSRDGLLILGFIPNHGVLLLSVIARS
jgi:hypothetical protein